GRCSRREQVGERAHLAACVRQRVRRVNAEQERTRLRRPFAVDRFALLVERSELALELGPFVDVTRVEPAAFGGIGAALPIELGTSLRPRLRARARARRTRALRERCALAAASLAVRAMARADLV